MDEKYTQATYSSPDPFPKVTLEPLPREYGIDVPSSKDISLLIGHLANINEVLRELHEFLKTKIYPPESQDLFKIVNLYKVSFGPNYIPSIDKQQRVFVYVYALQTTNIIITSPLASATSATIPPGKWVNLNFPDGTSFTLDSIATANQLNVYARYTMDSFNNDGPTVP